MKRLSRRDFGKKVAAAAVTLPLARVSLRGTDGAQQAEAPKPEPRLKLSKEQEEAVKKAVERRERQLAAIRSRTLPYEAEPAFVFRVRQRPRSGQKM